MATTIQQPPKIEPERLPSQGSGNGGWRNLVPAGGDLRKVKSYLTASGQHWDLGGFGGDHDDLRRLYQRSDRASGSGA